MDEVLINSFDMAPTGNEIWASDELGGLSHIDLREEKGKAIRWELSDKKTGCVSINPVQPHLLLVSSNNRTLKYVCAFVGHFFCCFNHLEPGYGMQEN